jgi:dihydrofolate reductase
VARPDRRGGPGAPFFNETEKLVVGANEPAEEWAKHDPARRVRRRRDPPPQAERDGVIYVSGSGQLVRGLIRDGLVDEVHLFVYPISLGEGERFWAEGEQNKLVLQAHDVYDNGVVHLSYGLA